MIEYLKLTNVGPASEMEVEFAPRLNIFTGDNGLGKSFLLDVIWWALTRKWPQEINRDLTSGYVARPRDPRITATIDFRVDAKSRTVEYTSTYARREQAWTGKAGRPPNPGLVLYAHADGGFSVWDPARNYWRKKGNVDVQDRLPAFVFSPKDVWDGLRDTTKEKEKGPLVCNGLILDWASWIRENGEDARNMATVLQRLSESDDPLDRLKPGSLARIAIDDARDIPTIHTAYAHDVPILHASAGVRRIVALSYMLLWSYKEHGLAARTLGEEPAQQVVMLVDELESHLHPRWQRTVLGALLRIVEVLHCKATVQLITVTHSPLVLASTEPFFDAAEDAWFDIDLVKEPGKAMVSLQRRDYVRHGDVSNWLTSNAFGLKCARSKEAEAAIEDARALLRETSPSLPRAREIDEALRKAGLPDIDPFWVRWSAFLKELGGGQ
ncbi:MAG: AAA family ATPase [Candidatus Riflebacteria bacterium]|nr:AAA family ATPase [Candidatus Riflebacteria bacterium]